MSKRQRNQTQKQHASANRARYDIALSDLKTIVSKARSALSEEDYTKLNAAVDTLAELTAELEAKGASVERLRRLLFGPSTEKTSNVVGGTPDAGSPIVEGKGASVNDVAEDQNKQRSDDQNQSNSEQAHASSADGAPEASPPLSANDQANDQAGDSANKPKRRGHGRNGASSYTGAQRIAVPLEKLKAGDPCDLCGRGKLYPYESSPLVRVTGVAPIRATIWELERLRCNACGEIFTAAAPEEVGTQKYDERAASMIALLRYGTGIPFFRLERLEQNLGIPLPDSTQWDIIEPAGAVIMPVFEALIRAAAQGTVLHNDDTPVQILELFAALKKAAEIESTADTGEERTGRYTTGVVSIIDGHKAVLFLSGRQHAGENLRDILVKRSAELPPPIQMSDALSSNTPKGCATIRAFCNVHARRNFVEIAEKFPDEVRHVLKQIEIIYINDDFAKQEKMSDQERLEYHQKHSEPVMTGLAAWMKNGIEERLIEPNSGLGKAIKYMRKHWAKLTLFLRQPGAPLDNNVCERALKKAILHRKNSLFYKTLNGAKVGDAFMSLIHTAEVEGINPYEYLTAMLLHPADVQESPEDWLPWNYEHTLAELNAIRDNHRQPS